MSPAIQVRATHITINKHLVALGIEDIVLAVLPSDALSPLLESLDGRLGPPVPQTSYHRLALLIDVDRKTLTMLIVLTTRVVKGVSQLVSSHSPESTVFEVFGPFVAVEGRLKDTSREDDFAIRRAVVGVYGLRESAQCTGVKMQDSRPCHAATLT